MTRLITRCPAAVLVLTAGIVCPAMAAAQLSVVPTSKLSLTAATSSALRELRGTATDERGEPLGGVVVSALGDTTIFAVSDREGRFTLRDLPPGPYLVRAHLVGYLPPKAKVVQVGIGTRDVEIALTHAQGSSDQPQLLQAGLGATDVPEASSGEGVVTEEQTEIAWRLRHLRRSVLKDVDSAVAGIGSRGSFIEDPLLAIARAVGVPVRFTSDFFADLPLNGQINLFTRSSFDRPQDLFSQGGIPANVAFVSLTSPTATGQWNVRGGTTQGDLSSWVVAGSSTWRSPGNAHHYRAGLSYAMQRYLGGNADALGAMADGRRNAGEMYAFDDWTVSDRLSLNYGARYARYGYLAHEDLLSPSAAVTVVPLPDASLRVRGVISHRELAPGAEEFLPPSTGIWLPPGRTFSPVSTRSGLRPERVDSMEVSAEQPLSNDVLVGMRVFRQDISSQTATLFGISLPGTTGSTLGHYYLGNAGDADVRGWGLSLSRNVEKLRASVDYTQTDAEWVRPSARSVRMATVAPSVMRPQFEQLRDLTTAIESQLPGVDTHVFVIYKINSGFAGSNAATLRPQLGTRFDVQVSQALPFLNFTSGQWEMIVAVRNLFREELLDTSVYDELQVVRPPKHIVGGVTVRF